MEKTAIYSCDRLYVTADARMAQQLYKASDLVLSIPAGAGEYWPSRMFKPIILLVLIFFIYQQTPLLAAPKHTKNVRNGYADARFV
jgi:hypothetical protein